MKFILIFVVCICAAFAKPQEGPVTEPVAIIRQESAIQPDGSYQNSYETANGISADETGILKQPDDPAKTPVITVQGKFSYTAPDGTVFTVTYVADDVGGFQPQGDHIPTAPPIPPEIQQALDYIASQPPAAV